MNREVGATWVYPPTQHLHTLQTQVYADPRDVSGIDMGHRPSDPGDLDELFSPLFSPQKTSAHAATDKERKSVPNDHVFFCPSGNG